MKIEKNRFRDEMTFSADEPNDYRVILGLADILGLSVYATTDGKTEFPSVTIKKEHQFYNRIKNSFAYQLKRGNEFEKKCTKLRKQLRANKIKPEV